MKSIITDLYYEVQRELEKIHRTKLLLSDRIALEKSIAKLEAIKKVVDYSNISPRS